ncbi:MAG: DUF799 family lipoprotein [Magnetococcales bacterium]|nr:DUF799 family lipoprotein [Magnetococcales bacterium]
MHKRPVMAFLLGLLILLSGCAMNPPPKADYTAFNQAKPRSILVVPVVNQSVEVTAQDYFLSTITIPLAERGYYVFPVNMVKRTLEDDGLNDANLVHNAPTEKLAALFGADAVLFITITRWDAQYMLLTTQVTVEMEYVLKSAASGEIIWNNKKTMIYQPQNNNSGGHPIGMLIAMAISAAITKAMPNYIPLATQANNQAIYNEHNGLPIGPYSKAKTE